MAKSPRKSPTSNGFEEAPQSGFEGAPLSGSVSDWVKQMEAEAEASGIETQREIASKAGKHRKKIEIAAREAAIKEATKDKPKTARHTTASKTARGVSIGASSDPATRAAAGLNPVAGMDISLEDAQSLAPGAVTATVDALSKLIETGSPFIEPGKPWTPHRPERPEKSEGGVRFQMKSEFSPSGDQPTAIGDLVDGVRRQERDQVLLGVTGSGKTFTMAKVIEETQRPA
jgi:excinuclease ABC subunit B